MKVDHRALAGIDAKINRAHEHFLSLHGEMIAWDKRRPYRLVPEVHDNGLKHFFRLHLDEPIPVEWAVILGEALHDLRSALEQTVYWLGVDFTGAEVDGCSFPVYTRKADFYKWSSRKNAWAPGCGMHKIRGIGPGPQAFIEALQPYPQRRAAYHFPVRALHDLWNQDKHRLVHLWGLRFHDPQIRVSKDVAANCQIGLNRHIVYNGAIVIRVVCAKPYARVEMGGSLNPTLEFLVGTRRSGGFSNSLWDVASINGDVTRKLIGAIGNQSRDIDLTVWSVPQKPAKVMR